MDALQNFWIIYVGLPEVCIVPIIILTAPVTVTSAEKSFSTLKIMKSYLRSALSQE
jgi:hypothetical protein